MSDFDIALAGPTLFDKAKALGWRVKDGTRIGPLGPEDVDRLAALGLQGLRQELSDLAGRPVKFMLYDTVQSAYKRGALWLPGF